MQPLHGNQDCHDHDHDNDDKMLQEPTSGAGQLCVLLSSGPGMLVLACMMQVTIPAFKSAVTHTLVKTSVTHDHITCKRGFVSSCTHKLTKRQATGVPCMKDHVSIPNAGFSQ